MTSKLARAATAADPALASAIRVLTLEADSIRALADSLDGAFTAAIDRLEKLAFGKTGGRVIVSGMGKSGHIARKITEADVVICLSNSGETPELNDLVAHAKRFEIPLIAIIGRAESTLAQAADIALILPKAPEACPLGLAPTTSTTMMLALGDALAVALLERRGFTAEDFQVLHPGGKLGKALIKVSDIMHTGEEVPLVPLGTGMRDAILVMTAKTFGCVGIADRGGKLVGVITDGDLRRHIDGDLFAQAVDQVMTRAPKTIRPNALAAEALGRMKASKVTALFVVAESKPLGILRIHDILRAGVV